MFKVGFGDHIRDLTNVFKPNEHVKITTSNCEYNIKPVTYEIKSSSEERAINENHIEEEIDEEIINCVLLR